MVLFSALFQLSFHFRMDDSLLAAAVGCIPKRSIFLLEDIDCAFSRIDESNSTNSTCMYGMTPKCNVTLSGLLNVLDGVASQEGVLFFATVISILLCLPPRILITREGVDESRRRSGQCAHSSRTH